METDRQRLFIEKVKQINEGKNKKPLMFIRTYGCQMNERDSEKIAGILTDMGYQQTQSEKEADFVIYNTCCIRENAENKVFGNLGRLKYYKDRNPGLRVALCGCMMQQDNIIEIVKNKYRQVDILFGTFNFHRLPELLYTNLTTDKPVFDIWEEHSEIVEDLPTLRKYRWKTGVNIMYGCDNFCAYCIVPYVRGRERSRKPSEIIKEIELLAKDGVKEILLLGQNVNSYGKGLDEEVSFAKLMRDINEIKEIKRVRFMTSHPKDFSIELIEAIADCENVCKYVHLPLQSGSSNVLKHMNRGYTKESYLDLADRIKKKIKNVSLTTDIIVGFPGETEEDFEDTLDVLEKVRFSGAFTFIYSRRTGTPAAKMPQLDENLIKERFERLLVVQNTIVKEENERFVGKTQRVLVDELSKKEENILTGRADGNQLVHFKGASDLLGEFVNVKINKNRAFFLEGELEDKNDGI